MHFREFSPASGAKVVAALALCFVVGCGSKSAPKLDEPLARSSLTAVLEAWKKGDRPDALKSQSPSIIVGDPNWSGGAKLVSFQIKEPVTSDGSNLHAPVELELEDGAGQRTKQEVTYIVGTSPTITVFPES